MKVSLTLFAIGCTLLSLSPRADESLQDCAAKKIRQMELIQKRHNASPTRSHSKKQSRDPRQQIEQIDEWLWKNCRSHAAEMRTIEQQYM